jgi:rfaE bifunctional protein nucleotidyltransferase chain/domain
MKQIVKISQISKIIQSLHHQNKKIVLVGGCFDLIHLGHLTFLQKAKQQGDILIVLLESDQKIRFLKGKNRPINSQLDRAKFLTHLKSVDIVVLLPPMKSNSDYQKIIEIIKPQFIAISQDDFHKTLKTQEAKSVRAKLITVTPVVQNQSTSSVIQKLINEN